MPSGEGPRAKNLSFPFLRAMGRNFLARDMRLDICPDVHGISLPKTFSLGCISVPESQRQGKQNIEKRLSQSDPPSKTRRAQVVFTAPGVETPVYSLSRNKHHNTNKDRAPSDRTKLRTQLVNRAKPRKTINNQSNN